MNLNYELKVNYKNDTHLRHELNNLAHDTFGIDFEKWYEYGAWDERYVPYSYFLDGKIIANASANILRFIINHQIIPVVQIGTVMTRDEFRGQGLASDLIKKIIDDYKDHTELIYLFPNENAMDFYKNLGFKEITDHLFSLKMTPEDLKYEIKKLNYHEDHDRLMIQDLINKNKYYSQKFSVLDHQAISNWYCINILGDCICYCEALKALILAKVKDHTLHVYDIISEECFSLELLKSIDFKDDYDQIKIYFTPLEHDDLDFETLPNEAMMVYSAHCLKDLIFAHPMTAQA